MVNWFILLIGAIYLYQTSQLPMRGIAGDPGSHLMPVVFGGLTVVIVVWQIIMDFKARSKERNAESSEDDRRKLTSVIVATIVMALYLVAMNPLGFNIATTLFLVVIGAFLRRPDSKKAWGIIGLFAICTTAFIYLIFGSVFHINLPEGIWLVSSSKGW